MCRGNSHGRCRVRPPPLPRGRAAKFIVPRDTPTTVAVTPCARVYAAMLYALARFDSVHVVAPAVVTPLMAQRRVGQAGMNTHVLVR